MTPLKPLKQGYLLYFATVCLVFLDFVCYVLFGNLAQSVDFLGWIYFIPSVLGHAALLCLPLFGMYALLTLACKNQTLNRTIYLIFACLLQMVLVTNGFVFNLYRFHINGFVLELLFGGGMTDIFVFDLGMVLKMLFLVIGSCILPCMLIVYFVPKIKWKLSSKRIVACSFLLFGCLCWSHLANVVAVAKKQSSIQKSATALPFFFPLTANSLMVDLGIMKVDELDKLNYNIPSADLNYPLHRLVTVDPITKPNIVYILIDSWNYSVFDSLVCPQITTFATKEAHRFTNHLSSSNGTRGSLFGLYFGLSLTYLKEFELGKVSPVLIDRFLNLKYQINTFPSANFTSPPFHELLYRRVPNICLRGEGVNTYERDVDITNRFVDFVDHHKVDVDAPFFSLLFYDLPHANSLPKEYRTHFTPSWDEPDYFKLNNSIDRTPFFNLYKNCVYQVDLLVGKVIESLRAKGLLENTVIVITGDHGQEFNENKKNFWGHGSNFSQWQLKVPFVLYYPGMVGGVTHAHTTTHYDVTPTIMSRFLGVTNQSSDYSFGQDLYATTTRYPHIAGDAINYAFLLPNRILETGHSGAVTITDGALNELPRDSIPAKEIQKAIQIKNRFYK